MRHIWWFCHSTALRLYSCARPLLGVPPHQAGRDDKRPPPSPHRLVLVANFGSKRNAALERCATSCQLHLRLLHTSASAASASAGGAAACLHALQLPHSSPAMHPPRVDLPARSRRRCPRRRHWQHTQHSQAVAEQLPLAMFFLQQCCQNSAAPPSTLAWRPCFPPPTPNVPLFQLSLSRSSGRRVRRPQEPHAAARYAGRCRHRAA